MPKVPIAPVGPVYQIPILDETTKAEEPKIEKPKRDPIFPEGWGKPKKIVNEKKTITNKEKTVNCSWCGKKMKSATSTIHEHCAETRARVKSERGSV